MLDSVGLIFEATRAQPAEALMGVTEPHPSLADLVESFIGIDLAETTAALHVLAAFVDDDVLRVRMRRELRGRRQPMPPAVTGVADLRATAGWMLTVPPSDVDHILVELAGPGGTPTALIVQVGRNLGVVTDAFTLDVPPAVLREQFVAGSGPEASAAELSLADLRAHLTDPVDLGDILLPAIETDTWPATRPLLRMLCRDLPDGGRGYPTDPEEVDTEEIVESVLATGAYRRAGLDTDPDSVDADIVHTLVSIADSFGFFEPLRWSPERAAQVLLDVVPRKLVAELPYLRRVPRVLSALVEAAAELTETPSWVVRESLEAIIDLEPAYLDTVAAGVGDPLGFFAPTADGAEDRLPGLEAMMGGAEALAGLHADAVAPLLERPLDVSGAPNPVREAALAVDELATGVIDTLVEESHRGEYRAAVRTLVERLARTAPDSLRRGKPANTAAALCWAVGRANDLLGDTAQLDLFRHAFDVGPIAAKGTELPEKVPVKALFAHLGVPGNVTTRAGSLLQRLGYATSRSLPGTYVIGDPALLTSEKRRRIALERDHWAPALEG